MGTAIKHPVPDRVKPYVICNFWHLGTLTLGAERIGVPRCQYWRLIPVRHGMLHSCIHMGIKVGIKGLSVVQKRTFLFQAEYRTWAVFVIQFLDERRTLGVSRSLGNSRIQRVGYRKSSNVDRFDQVMNASSAIVCLQHFAVTAAEPSLLVVVIAVIISIQYNTIQYNIRLITVLSL